MLKISMKLSVVVSLVVAFIFLGACIYGAFILPPQVEMLIDMPDNIGNRGDITENGRLFVHIIAYILLFVFALADSFMILLLLRVRKSLVFSAKSIALIRAISWCFFAICLCFVLLGVYFQLALIMAFFAIFLGISLRVVKNVIEEATEIKSENDLTV